MARSKEVKEALARARKIEKHHVPSKKELDAEDSAMKKLAKSLRNLLSPQWYMKPRRSGRKK